MGSYQYALVSVSERLFRLKEPLAILAFGILFGQFLEMYNLSLWIVLSLSLVTLASCRKKPLLVLALLCGVLQVRGLPEAYVVKEVGSSEYQTGTLLVLSKPVAKRPGQVYFTALFREEGDSEAKRLRCEVKMLPWRNSAGLRGGNQREAFIRVLSLKGDSRRTRQARRRGHVAGCKVIYLSRSNVSGEVSSLLAFRAFIYRSVERAFPESEGGGVVRAMILGDSSGVSYRTRSLFQDWGVAHLLVVSGLHVAALFCTLRIALGWLLQFLVFSGPSLLLVRFLPDGVGLLITWGYVFLLGFPVSATRAACGITCYLILGLFGYDSFIRRLVVAGLLLISLWPGVWEELGFQLTFSALLAIFIAIRSKERSRLRSYLLFALLPGIFTSLVLYLHLGRVPLFGAVGNVFLAPILLFFGFYGGLASLVLVALFPSLGSSFSKVHATFIEDGVILLSGVTRWMGDAYLVDLLIGILGWGCAIGFVLSSFALRDTEPSVCWKIFHYLTNATNNTTKWVICSVKRDFGILFKPFRKSSRESTAPCEVNTS